MTAPTPAPHQTKSGEGEHDPSPPGADGQQPAPPARLAAESDSVQGIGDFTGANADSVERSVEPHDLRDRQLWLKAGRLQLHSQPGLRTRGLAADLEPVEEHLARAGLDQALNGAERARLTGSVGTEKTKNLAARDKEASNCQELWMTA